MAEQVHAASRDPRGYQTDHRRVQAGVRRNPPDGTGQSRPHCAGGGHGKGNPSSAKAQAEQHGFALPLSKFAACLTPDISGEDAAGIIGQVYAAEAEAREESKPAHVVKPAEPRPDSFIEREEGFPFAPPVNVACTLTLSVKYAPKYEDTVQEALAMLRTVGVVTVF